MKTIFALLGIVFVLGACSSSDTAFTQVERIGRPAVNEGLVLKNSLLNAFNSVPPSVDLTAAASPVIDHIVGTLTLLNYVGTKAGLTPPTVIDVAAGFVPDVLRINLTRASGYIKNGSTNNFEVVTDVAGTTAPVMLTGGRLLTDDVIDITLSYLLGGGAAALATPPSVGDNVSYDGSGGADPDLQGHTAVMASFPYLARPR